MSNQGPKPIKLKTCSSLIPSLPTPRPGTVDVVALKKNVKSKIKTILANPKTGLESLFGVGYDLSAIQFNQNLRLLTAQLKNPKYIMQILQAFKQQDYKKIPMELCSSNMLYMLIQCKLDQPLTFICTHFRLHDDALQTLAEHVLVTGNCSLLIHAIQNDIDYVKEKQQLDFMLPPDRGRARLLNSLAHIGVKHSEKPLELMLQKTFHLLTLTSPLNSLLDWSTKYNDSTENVQKTFELLYQATLKSNDLFQSRYQTFFAEIADVMQQRWPQESPESASALTSIGESGDSVLIAYTMQMENDDASGNTFSVEQADDRKEKRKADEELQVDSESKRPSKRLKTKK